MGGHHKKNLRAEKAKVKLKGAKLPKGLNVTKTDFKVRKITIREQLKETQYVDGLRQVSLKETLSRLKHHSSNFRLEALRNLRDAIAAGHPGITTQLGEIVQGTAAICLDVDKETRRESFKTLSALLSALQADAVAPFFHVISSYMRCAMTHIQPALQEDSLLMLDVLLQHVPRLVAAQNSKIFQNFFEMISRVRAEGDRTQRTLTVQMGQKQTSVKWRSKVLFRLQKMLQIQVEHERQSRPGTVKNHSCQTLTFSAKEPQHYSLKRHYATGAQVCDLADIFANSGGSHLPKGEAQALHAGYFEQLLPLLLEAWLEVRPQEATAGAQVMLSHDAALTLQIVVGIMENLWTLLEMHEREVNNNELSLRLQQEYGTLFVINFLQTGFPYQQCENNAANGNDKRKSNKKTQPEAGGQYCLPQNISLVHLMCRFHSSENVQQHVSIFSQLLEYLNTIMCHLQQHSLEYYRQLVPALHALFLLYGQELLRFDEASMRQLLRSTIKAFLSNQLTHKDGKDAGLASKVLVLLCDIVQSPDLHNAYGGTEFGDFLQYLPQLLLRPSITEAALVSMSNLGKQQNVLFLKALSALIEPVIENIQKIQVVGAVNAFEGKKHIMNLFYWTERNWSNEVLLKKVDDNISDKRIVAYFKFILCS